MEPRRADWAWLGRAAFDRTAVLQERLREAVLRGERPDTLLLCEHDPVITMGRRTRPEHLLVSAAELDLRGILVRAASRGGDITYHGPGQLVGYPIFRLRRGVVGHLEAMAAAIAEVLASLGLRGTWRRDLPGVWIDDEKICAFGVHVRHRVTIHGFALNVSTPLEAFSAIVPCGLAGAKVTSIARRLGHAPSPEALAPAVAAACARAFALDLSAAREPWPE